MFVVELIYKADLAAIDAQMRPHMAFLKKHYAAGTFVVSGRKVPRDGGVIIAAAASVCGVRVISKGVISRTYGKRKVDEYLQDDAFWDEQTEGGKLRKMSREAAMLLVATRNG